MPEERVIDGAGPAPDAGEVKVDRQGVGQPLDGLVFGEGASCVLIKPDAHHLQGAD
jgi:hypothetical protein